MKRLSDAQVRRMAQHADVDLAPLVLELLARLAEDRYGWTPPPDARPLLERLEAER